ncbi:hypothetical protein ACWGIB_08260 [Streptomyces xiamenensis]
MKSLRHLLIFAATLSLAGCSLISVAPEGDKAVPPKFPHDEISNAGWAHTQAQSFMAWASLMGTDEQRAAVDGRVVNIGGDWSDRSGIAWVLTDHVDSEEARIVADAFSQWEENADIPVRVAIYGSAQELLYLGCSEGEGEERIQPCV